MVRRRRLKPTTTPLVPNVRPTYQDGLLHTYRCGAIRMRRQYSRNPQHWDGAQCEGMMRLQPVVAQRDDWQMLSYLCNKCGRIAWVPTYDANLTSEQEPT